MKGLSGSTPWSNKKKRIIRLCCFLMVLIAAVLLYARYISGDIYIDPNKITDENLNAIAANWEKLVDAGLCYEFPGTESEILNKAGIHILQYFASAGDYVGLYTYDSETPYEGMQQFPAQVRYAFYRRKGMKNVIHGTGRFGECTCYIAIENPVCMLEMRDYESDGTSSNFDVVFQTIMEAIEK